MACHLYGTKPLSEAIFNMTLAHKLQHDLNNTFFISNEEDAFENVISKKSAILLTPDNG